jgi:uncharacterized protein Usg
MTAAFDFKRQLEGYGLTTANILYRLPDHPAFLQTYFWKRELEGPLHSVKVAHRRLIAASEVRTLTTELRLN